MDATTDPIEEAALSLLVSEEPSAPEADAGDLPSDEAEPDDDEGDAPALDAEADDDPASDDDQDEPAGPDEAADLHDYKVDGQVRKATLEELKQKAALADGAHARMQRAGEAEKAAQAAAATFQREFQALQAFHAQVRATGFMPPPQPPNPALAQQNPAAWVKAQAEFQGRVQAYQQQQAQRQRAQAIAAQAAEMQRQAQLAQARERLPDVIPEYRDPAKWEPLREKMQKLAREDGFTAEEIESADERHLKVLRDALAWRELQARQREAKKPTPTPRHVAPSAAKRPEPPQLAHARQLRQTLEAKGGRLSVDDAAAALLIPQPRKR